MKNIKIIIFSVIIFLGFNQWGNAQACTKDYLDDIEKCLDPGSPNNGAFYDYMHGLPDNEVAEAYSAWARIRNAVNATDGYTALATDPATIDIVRQLSRSDSDFRLVLGPDWESRLNDIISTTKNTPVKTGPPPSGNNLGRHFLDEYLSYVDYYIKNFNVQPDGKTNSLFKNLTGDNNPNPGEIDEVHQIVASFARKNVVDADIDRFDKYFDSAPVGYSNKKFDIEFQDGLNKEFKNKYIDLDNGSIATNDVEQFIRGYIHNSGSWSKIEWEIGFLKFKNNGQGNYDDVLLGVKKLWQKVFKNQPDVFEEIWNNLSLRTELFQDLEKTMAQTIFNDLVDNLDPILFDFVKLD